MQFNAFHFSDRFVNALIRELLPQYGFPEQEVADLVEEERRNTEKKLAGKNGKSITDPEKQVSDNCHRRLRFRQKDAELELKVRLKNRDTAAWEEMAGSVRRDPVLAFLHDQGCKQPAHAEVIYHDALVVLYEALQRDDFHLDALLKTFLCQVCRFMWFKKQRDESGTVSWEDYFVGADPDTEEEEATGFYPGNRLLDCGFSNVSQELEDLVMRNLNKMGNQKYRIFIKVKYLLRLTHAAIAHHLGITVENSAITLKRAMDTLKASVLRDPQLGDILN